MLVIRTLSYIRGWYRGLGCVTGCTSASPSAVGGLGLDNLWCTARAMRPSHPVCVGRLMLDFHHSRASVACRQLARHRVSLTTADQAGQRSLGSSSAVRRWWALSSRKHPMGERKAAESQHHVLVLSVIHYNAMGIITSVSFNSVNIISHNIIFL